MVTGRDFEGSIVVVTGASTGLGRAIAVETAQRGAAAVIVNFASSEAEARETVRLVEDAGSRGLACQGDVAKDEDCIRIAGAAAPFGRIDALFNNAGVTRFASNHAQLDAGGAEDFQRLYAINVIGAYQMVRAARTLMEAAAKPAGVVNTASVAGVLGIGSSVPYAASKGALITMTLSLARALAPKIRVNAICPGYIDTPWFGRAMDEAGLARLRKGVEASTPLKVVSSAEDIAGAAVFLASPAARHITGETLMVDGGTHLGYAPLGMR